MNKQQPWPPLNQRKQFDQGFDQGRRQHGKHFMLLHWQAETPRLGMIVSRKVDARAVVRNRIKRVVREAVRQHEWPDDHNMQLIVLVKRSASQVNNDGLRTDFVRLIKRAINATHQQNNRSNQSEPQS